MKTIFKAIFGSKCYGTDDENSDTDIRGIYLPTIRDYLKLERKNEIRINDEEVYFSIDKFFKLAIENNPSVFEWMWIPNNLILEATEEFIPILENREKFLSKQLFYKFKGYAMSEFDEMSKLTGKTGEKRKKMILEYGYDPKKAMNCIRLIEQAKELLLHKEIIFPRPDREMFLSIKRGEKRQTEINSIFHQAITQLEYAMMVSKLPVSANKKYLEDLMINIIENQKND
jgi:hypothetical protein